ncbi:TRAP transporter TatT component family protein [Breznakiella homolactica]|uniref:TRAP transporter TatT component family protein n=1 Tax=Breznakiella homolactica TaxID=2798577 RepID=A0A7T7XLE3_9SPIR|nr:TRAP transporter TatT component family protein [Breznakiella homolactica]QQO08559.1 TRAP transporter TatT component family protein [Breznakiella homolactica]
MKKTVSRGGCFILGALVLGLTLFTSCSTSNMAMKAVSDMLTGSGSTDAFTADNDPELVGDALPFAIKLYEVLLSKNPDHDGLLLTTGSLFVMYANAFVQGPASMLSPGEYSERDAQYKRAKNLYIRGVDILSRGLENKYPGFADAYDSGSLDTVLSKMGAGDVPLLYWTVAGTLSAYSLDPFDLKFGLKVPQLAAMIARAYELDPDFNDGAIDDFYILFYASLPASLGGNPGLVDRHFELALERSRGLSAGPYVSYATSVCIPAQNYPLFKEYLNKALEIDPDANPSGRLVNIISQRKARYLLDSAPEYFIDLGEDEALYYGDFYEYD